MDEEEKWPATDLAKNIERYLPSGREREELWQRYSSVWRNILTRVLDWQDDRTNSYINQLRRQMETSYENPVLDPFGFFYDPPSHDLFGAIIGQDLHKRLMNCQSNDANPSLIFSRLVRAIAGGQIERDTEKPDFDWAKARERYVAERSKIEAWLSSLK